MSNPKLDRTAAVMLGAAVVATASTLGFVYGLATWFWTKVADDAQTLGGPRG